MQLVPVKSPAEFRLTSLIQIRGDLSRGEKAAAEFFECCQGVWQKMPVEVQDFLLRAFRSFGLPIDYQPLPFWLEKAARHLFTICYPTLRNADFKNPTPEDCGRVTGHLLALIAHAKEDAAIFQRLPTATSKEVREFLIRIEEPVRVFLDEGLRLPVHEAKPFLVGLNDAFGKTFDSIGFPRGWNTNSPVQFGICLLWRFIVSESPSLPALHHRLAQVLGSHIVGDEDRVKKICHRLGLRFSGNRALDSKGTPLVLDVPSATKMISDK